MPRPEIAEELAGYTRVTPPLCLSRDALRLYGVVPTPLGNLPQWVTLYDGPTPFHPVLATIWVLAFETVPVFWDPPVELDLGLYIEYYVNLHGGLLVDYPVTILWRPRREREA